MEKYLADNATFADSPFIPGSAVYQPNAFWYSYDQALAASFLEAVSGASSETDDSGDAADNGDEGDDDFTFTLLVQDRSPFRELASDIVEQWHALGFHVTSRNKSPPRNYWTRLMPVTSRRQLSRSRSASILMSTAFGTPLGN